jgi:hypothetical protein
MLDLPEHGSADTGFGREAVAGPTEKLARGRYLSARDHISPWDVAFACPRPHTNTNTEDDVPSLPFASHFLGLALRLVGSGVLKSVPLGEKSEIISYLPQALVYQLAAPSTPATVRDEIVKRFDSGERIYANEIKYALKEARKAERTNVNRQSTKERNDAKRLAFLAKLPDDQRAKLLKTENRAELRRLQERAEQDRRDTEYKAERAAEMAAAAEAVALLRRALSNEQIDTLFDLATKAGRYLTERLANRGEEVVRREIWLPTMLGVP